MWTRIEGGRPCLQRYLQSNCVESGSMTMRIETPRVDAVRRTLPSYNYGPTFGSRDNHQLEVSNSTSIRAAQQPPDRTVQSTNFEQSPLERTTPLTLSVGDSHQLEALDLSTSRGRRDYQPFGELVQSVSFQSNRLEEISSYLTESGKDCKPADNLVNLTPSLNNQLNFIIRNTCSSKDANLNIRNICKNTKKIPQRCLKVISTK